MVIGTVVCTKAVHWQNPRILPVYTAIRRGCSADFPSLQFWCIPSGVKKGKEKYLVLANIIQPISRTWAKIHHPPFTIYLCFAPVAPSWVQGAKKKSISRCGGGDQSACKFSLLRVRFGTGSVLGSILSRFLHRYSAHFYSVFSSSWLNYVCANPHHFTYR